MTLRIFSCANLPSIFYLFFGKMFNLLPIKTLGYFLNIEFGNSIYSEYKSFIISMICKFFCLVYPFHFMNNFFQRAEVFNLDQFVLLQI